jgi:FKBP-type peptidyl-prolyl cis-trans isomerase
MSLLSRFAAIFVAVLLLPAVGIAEDLPAKDDDDARAFGSRQDGLVVGRALARHLAGDDVAVFVAGLLEGIGVERSESGEDANTPEELNAARRAWLDAPDRTLRERASFAYGYALADGHEQDGSSASSAHVLLGYLEALQNDGPAYLAPVEAAQLIDRVRRNRFYAQKREIGRDIQARRVSGEAYLTNFDRRPGVVKTESGLRYRILQKGSGPSPGPQDRVELAVRGTKIDGEVFYDSEPGGDDPLVELRVEQTLDGWQEVLPMMSRGARWEIVLPAPLAYGNAGWKDAIEPGETLVYRLTLRDFTSRSEE